MMRVAFLGAHSPSPHCHCRCLQCVPRCDLARRSRRSGENRDCRCVLGRSGGSRPAGCMSRNASPATARRSRARWDRHWLGANSFRSGALVHWTISSTRSRRRCPPRRPAACHGSRLSIWWRIVLRAGKFPAGQTDLSLATLGQIAFPAARRLCRVIDRRLDLRRRRQPRAVDAGRHVPEREHPVQRAGEGSRQGKAGDADTVRLRRVGWDGVLRMAGGRSGGPRAHRDVAAVPAARTAVRKRASPFRSIAPTGSSTPTRSWTWDERPTRQRNRETPTPSSRSPNS